MEALDNRPIRNATIDITKFIGSLCVVYIHTRFFTDISSELDFFVSEVISRFAVPFFAICTGFYFAHKMEFEDSDARRLKNTESNRKNFVKVALRFIMMYLLWSIFYLIILSFQWMRDGYISIEAYVGWLKSFMIGGAYYHLWYLYQIIVGILLLWPILRFFSSKYLVPITILLWIVVIWNYVYGSVFLPEINFVAQRLRTIIDSTCRLLPLLLLGVVIFQSKRHIPLSRLVLYAFISLVLLYTEVLLLRRLGAERFSFVIMTLPLAYFLFATLKSFVVTVRFDTQLLANSSMVIFFIHPAVLYLIGLSGFKSAFFIGILTIVISSLLGFMYAYIKQGGLLSIIKR